MSLTPVLPDLWLVGCVIKYVSAPSRNLHHNSFFYRYGNLKLNGREGVGKWELSVLVRVHGCLILVACKWSCDAGGVPYWCRYWPVIIIKDLIVNCWSLLGKKKRKTSLTEMLLSYCMKQSWNWLIWNLFSYKLLSDGIFSQKLLCHFGPYTCVAHIYTKSIQVQC